MRGEERQIDAADLPGSLGCLIFMLIVWISFLMYVLGQVVDRLGGPDTFDLNPFW